MRGDTAGVVLAGGQARRMGGGDKPLLRLGGQPMLGHVLARLAPQVLRVAISANGPPERFAQYGVPIVPDSVPGWPGPLAGVLAALDWAAAERPALPWVVSAPGDCPFLPPDLVGGLHRAREAAGTPMACACSGPEARLHPTVALWPVALRESLRAALAADQRQMARFAAHHGLASAAWPADPVDPFFNVNTPEDLALAEALLGTAPGGGVVPPVGMPG